MAQTSHFPIRSMVHLPFNLGPLLFTDLDKEKGGTQTPSHSMPFNRSAGEIAPASASRAADSFLYSSNL